MLCAAMTEPLPGDTYIDDTLHYKMSVEHRVIVAEPMEFHAISGEWWWRGAVPEDVVVAEYYLDQEE